MDINQKQEVEVRRATSCGGSVEHLRGLGLKVLQSDGRLREGCRVVAY